MPRITEKVKKIRFAKKKGDLQNSQLKDLQMQADPLGNDHAQIIKQVQDEYELCWKFIRPKIKEWLIRLALYNNQKRAKEDFGDPLMFTIHQTILASLYHDKLAVDFGGREEGDEEVAENLNALAEFDYDETRKAELDYEWIWDATAFGRGLLLFNEFDLESKSPVAQVLDPTTVLRDPRATSVNGDRKGYNAMRFGGFVASRTREEMNDNDEYFNLHLIDKNTPGAVPTNVQSLLQDARLQRRSAQGLTTLPDERATVQLKNREYEVLIWLTHIDGEKYFLELANDRKLLVRMIHIDENEWPIIDRPIYPNSHDWDGVSVFDMTEDKQRFRAALVNTYGKAARADILPTYIFNENKLKKDTDKNFGFNKWIPVDGDITGAAAPLIKSNPTQHAQVILGFLDQAAQRALATPEIQQGQLSRDQRTLGEIELVASKVDTRYSLAAKIFGWSEWRYWRRWYQIYNRDFRSGIHDKTVRLVGAFGPSWKNLSRDKIITNHPLGPDIKIESKILSEARKNRNFIQFGQYLAGVGTIPGADLLYGYRKLGRFIMKRDEVERLLPLTVDERVAKDENDKLNENEPQLVTPDDDHVVHLRIHAAAKEGEARDAHIKMHEVALMAKKVRPDLFPAQQGSDAVGALGGRQGGGGTFAQPSGVGGARAPQEGAGNLVTEEPTNA